MKIKSFNVYPPDNDSIFIGCVFVKPDYRNMAIGQRLLLSLEKDMVKKRVRALEIIGQRDSILKEPRSLVPVKYLIKNGFYIKKNDSCWPLLRLDINSLVPDSRLEKILRRNVVINKRVEAPGRLYNK
ncbi:MAG: GNAT family N-acetyltransferase [Actinomycetota bacterium]|nr:GNAT family N-acetyltransferase [Actinomycetota bacterium]